MAMNGEKGHKKPPKRDESPEQQEGEQNPEEQKGRIALKGRKDQKWESLPYIWTINGSKVIPR